MNDANKIIKYLTSAAQVKQPLSAEEYMRAARSLVLFLGDEKDKLLELESAIAQMTVTLKQDNPDMPVAELRIRREAWPEYLEMKKQKARVEQIIEFIRIAKLHARISHEEMSNQNMT